jgi:hypothetical protein
MTSSNRAQNVKRLHCAVPSAEKHVFPGAEVDLRNGRGREDEPAQQDRCLEMGVPVPGPQVQFLGRHQLRVAHQPTLAHLRAPEVQAEQEAAGGMMGQADHRSL